MALIVADRVHETSTTTGAGAYTLLGAITGYRTASSVCTNGDTFTYYAEDIDDLGRSTGAWETGLGTWGTGNILTRTTIYASTNAGAAVSWGPGTRRIGLGLVANAALGPTSITGTLAATGNITGANLSGTNTGDQTNIAGNAATATNTLQLNGYGSTNFHQRVSYSTTARNSGYYKIKILPATSWMLSFTIRLYQTYRYDDIRISGYNHGSNHWYIPLADLLNSSATSIEVRFGYDSSSNLWVAVPAGNYTGLEIINIANGYVQVDHNWANNFTIINETSLTGTVQTMQTVYRPLKYNENASTATTLQTARTINGVSFDGSSNITLTAAANGGTSAACSGNAATATTAYNLTGAIYGSSGTSYSAATQVREAGLAGAQGSAAAAAPRLAFHWSGVVASSISLNSAGDFFFDDNPGTGRANIHAGTATATTFNSLSDINFKDNIVPLAGSLDIIKQLNGYSFDWKDGSGSSYGVIAQEVEKIIPNAVTQGKDQKSVNYAAIVPFLIEAVKKQQATIELLESRINKLEASVNACN